jgi:ABC-type nitrate/sulfonate/bicarbonate transport system permease component
MNLPGLATILFCLLIWELLIREGFIAYAYLPAPSSILAGFGELVSSGTFLDDLLHTLSAVILGWAIASAIGIAFGMLLGISPGLRRYSLASIEILRPMPGIAFVPAALLLFGFSLKTELVVIVLPSMWPVLMNTMGGVASVHHRLHEVGATLRLSFAALVRKILLPAAMPSVLVGLRLSLTLALVLAIVAEMVGNPTGLGYAIVRDQQALRPDLMFADLFVVGGLGMLLNALIISTGRLLSAPAGAEP